MILWLAFAVLAGAVSVLLILPLARGGTRGPARADYDRAVFRDQLREIARDLERGVITEMEAAPARLEIERRLLATAGPGEAAAAPRLTRGIAAVAIGLAFAVPAGAVAIYLLHGAPRLPDQPFAGRGAERALSGDAGSHDFDQAAATLEARVAANPGDADAWLLLARTQAARQHWQESAAAYHQALALTKQRPDVAAAYGEMLVLAADGMVTPAARDAFVMTLAREPKNPAARYYLALADAQAGNAEAAIGAWQKLLADSTADAPWVGTVKDRIAETAKAAGLPVPPAPPPAPATPGLGNDELAAAAGMTPEARAQMIRGMVDRLAQRLQEKPDDIDGWLRLGRAYQVLDEPDKAADAYERAAALAPQDPAILAREADALLMHQKPTEPIPTRTVAVLKRLDTLDGNDPRTLWYLGLAAAQERRPGDAQSYWSRLLALLPPESEEHKAVAAALAALSSGK
jgi:cytochrome c-type biogenesis protein CcmH